MKKVPQNLIGLSNVYCHFRNVRDMRAYVQLARIQGAGGPDPLLPLKIT